MARLPRSSLISALMFNDHHWLSSLFGLSDIQCRQSVSKSGRGRVSGMRNFQFHQKRSLQFSQKSRQLSKIILPKFFLLFPENNHLSTQFKSKIRYSILPPRPRPPYDPPVTSMTRSPKYGGRDNPKPHTHLKHITLCLWSSVKLFASLCFSVSVSQSLVISLSLSLALSVCLSLYRPTFLSPPLSVFPWYIISVIVCLSLSANVCFS